MLSGGNAVYCKKKCTFDNHLWFYLDRMFSFPALPKWACAVRHCNMQPVFTPALNRGVNVMKAYVNYKKTMNHIVDISCIITTLLYKVTMSCEMEKGIWSWTEKWVWVRRREMQLSVNVKWCVHVCVCACCIKILTSVTHVVVKWAQV